jgi:hypothetical protein
VKHAIDRQRTGSTILPPIAAFDIDTTNFSTSRTVLKQTASGNTYLPSLQYCDYIKRALDRMGTPTAQLFARNLRDSLDTLVPSYAQARAAAQPTRWFNGASNAYDAGQNFINRGVQFGPEAQQMIQRMTLRSRDYSGMDILTPLLIASTTPVIAGPSRTGSTTIRTRNEIATALGPQRAAEIEGQLHLENLMDTARQG